MDRKDPVELLKAVSKAVQSDSLDDFVKRNPEVLTPAFLQFLAQLGMEMIQEGETDTCETVLSLGETLADYRDREKPSATSISFDGLPADVKKVLANDLIDAEAKGDRKKIVKLCRSVIPKIDEGRFPSVAAMMQLKLATTLLYQSKSDDSIGMEEPIRCLKRVVALLPAAEHPDEVALAHYNLAAAYSQPSWDDPAGDIERVIEHGEKALAIVSGGRAQSVPELGIHNLLAEAYISRESGDREDNLDSVIKHLEAMLKSSGPEEKRCIHNNLAVVYSKRTRGGKAQNKQKFDQHMKLAAGA